MADALARRKEGAIQKLFSSAQRNFSLKLSPGALAVYSYLLYCEDRKTYQCYPSYASIGRSVGMSANTVRKYVAELEERGLVVTEPTTIVTKDGRKRNGSLRYTILPIQNAVDLHNQHQLRRLEEVTGRMRISEKLKGNEEHTA